MLINESAEQRPGSQLAQPVPWHRIPDFILTSMSALFSPYYEWENVTRQQWEGIELQ